MTWDVGAIAAAVSAAIAARRKECRSECAVLVKYVVLHRASVALEVEASRMHKWRSDFERDETVRQQLDQTRVAGVPLSIEIHPHALTISHWEGRNPRRGQGLAPNIEQTAERKSHIRRCLDVNFTARVVRVDVVDARVVVDPNVGGYDHIAPVKDKLQMHVNVIRNVVVVARYAVDAAGKGWSSSCDRRCRRSRARASCTVGPGEENRGYRENRECDQRSSNREPSPTPA